MMKPAVYSPPMQETNFPPVAASSAALPGHSPFYPGTGMDPGRTVPAFTSQPVSAAPPTALNKGQDPFSNKLTLVNVVG